MADSDYSFTDLTADYVLDQIFGYQDANEARYNSQRQKGAYAVEHEWANSGATDYGKHSDGFCVTAYLDDLAVTNAKLATDAVTQVKVANNAIGYNELNTSSDLTTQPANGNQTISSTDQYRFGPFVWKSTSGGANNFLIKNGIIGDVEVSSHYSITRTTIGMDWYISSNTGGLPDLNFQFRFVTSTPPHMLLEDEEDWGLFVWAIMDSNTSEILTLRTMQDPPWYRFNHPLFEKNHPMRMHLAPHPFKDYEFPGHPNTKVVLFDLRSLNEEETSSEEYDKLQAQREFFEENAGSLGIEEAQINQMLSMQEAKVDQEQIQIAKGEADIEKALIWRDKKRRMLKALKEDRSNIDRKEAMVEAHAKYLINQGRKKAKKFRRFEKIIAKAKMKGRTIHDEIFSGNLPEVNNATHELPMKEKKKLPQIPAFRNNVTILQTR